MPAPGGWGGESGLLASPIIAAQLLLMPASSLQPVLQASSTARPPTLSPLLFGILVWLLDCSLVQAGGRARDDARLAQQPRHGGRGLRPHRQPVLDALQVEAQLLVAILSCSSTRAGVGRAGMRGDKLGRVCAGESQAALQAPAAPAAAEDPPTHLGWGRSAPAPLGAGRPGDTARLLQISGRTGGSARGVEEGGVMRHPHTRAAGGGQAAAAAAVVSGAARRSTASCIHAAWCCHSLAPCAQSERDEAAPPSPQRCLLLWLARSSMKATLSCLLMTMVRRGQQLRVVKYGVGLAAVLP